MEDYPLKWITEYLAVGYAPRSEGQLQCINAAGVEAILNLCAECYDLHEAQKEAGFDVCHVAIADEDAPNVEQMNAIAEWVDLKKSEGKRILVHCRYGIGRTGTVVLVYLLHSGLNFQSAKKMLRETPAWPSTRTQKRLVDYYIKTLQCDNTDNWFDDKRTGSVGRFFKRMEAALKWDD